MALTLTLRATSNSITATVSGLDTSYTNTRKFMWYLDGVLRAVETVEPGSSEHTYTITGVYFASEHSVRTEIYNAENGALLAVTHGNASTLYANIPLWSWSASNGTASAAQTAAAYAAATSKGLVTDFRAKVWNDLVTLLHTALTGAGARWTGIGYNNILLSAGDPLTAQKFNAVVQNLRYPYWEWGGKPDSAGYLGRQDMRSGDWVYGKYIIELAKRLNTVIGIYNGTANTLETGYTESMSLRLDDVFAVSRHSAPAAYTEHILLDDTARAVSRPSEPAEINQSMLLSNYMGLIAKGKADMEYYEDMALLNRLHIAVNGNLLPAAVDAGVSELTARMAVDASPTLHLPGGAAASAVTTAAVLRGLISGRMEAEAPIIARMAADLRRYASRRISAPAAIAARTSAELTRYMAGILASAVRLSETVQAGMARAQAKSAASVVTVRIADSGSMRAARAANTGGETEIVHTVIAAADRATPHSAAAEVSQTVIQTGALRKAAPRSAAAQSAFTLGTTAQAKPCKPLSVFADAEVSHAASGAAVKSRPKLLTGHAVSGADGTGTAALRPTLRMAGQSGSVVSFTAALNKQKTLHLSGAVGVTATIASNLEIDGGEGKWKKPVQIGDELTIYQVHLVGQHNDIVRIDWVRYAEFAVSEEMSIEHRMDAFVSRGWAFPSQKKRILTIYQTLIARHRNDVLMIDYPWTPPTQEGDELYLGDTNLRVRNNEKLQVDWARYSELSGSDALSLRQTVTSFVSAGWAFPEQYKRILTVYQSTSVTAGNNEIEVS